MMNREKLNSNWIAGIFAIVTAQIFLMGFLKIPAFAQRLSNYGNQNILFYGMYLVLFLFCFFCGAFILKKVTIIIPKRVGWLLNAGVFLTALLFLLFLFKNESLFLTGMVEPFFWLTTSKVFCVFMIMVFSVIVFARIREAKTGGRNWVFYLFYGVLAFLSGYSLYMPNYLQADPLHGHAYYASMYHVVHGRAYDDLFTSIYGHYAIFFKWPLKIIGNGNIKDAAFLIAVTGGVAALCIMLVIHHFCRNQTVRILGSVASVLPAMGLRLNNYWQVQPHRVLFSSLFLLYTMFYLKNRTKWTAVGGYLLGILAVLWNTETGVVCAVAWAALQCYLYLEHHFFWKGTSFLFFAEQIGGIVFSFFGAYGIVNVYNLLHGGEINSLRTFLYPLLTGEYMTGYLRMNLPDVAAGYMLELVLFLGAVVWSFSGHFFLNKKQKGESSEKHQFLFFTGILGLGQITYYMNRAAYFNLDIVYTIFVVLVRIYLEAGIDALREVKRENFREKSSKELLKINTAIIMTIILTALSLGTFVQSGHELNERAGRGYQDMSSVYAFLEELKKDVPINTFGFGQGVPELYGLMGWDTRCHVIDFSDRTELSLQYVRDSLEHETGFFAFIQDAEFILEEQTGVWYAYKTYEYAGDEYAFFMRQ